MSACQAALVSGGRLGSDASISGAVSAHANEIPEMKMPGYWQVEACRVTRRAT